MEAAQNKSDYSFEAIQDILEQLVRINDLIRMHEAQESTDKLSLNSWKKMKKQLTLQFIELLNSLNLDISIEAKAA